MVMITNRFVSHQHEYMMSCDLHEISNILTLCHSAAEGVDLLSCIASTCLLSVLVPKLVSFRVNMRVIVCVHECDVIYTLLGALIHSGRVVLRMVWSRRFSLQVDPYTQQSAYKLATQIYIHT